MRLFVRDKNFYKKTAAIAIPISLQSLITIGVNMTDNIMIGSLGENALSGTALPTNLSPSSILDVWAYLWGPVF